VVFEVRLAAARRGPGPGKRGPFGPERDRLCPGSV